MLAILLAATRFALFPGITQLPSLQLTPPISALQNLLHLNATGNFILTTILQTAIALLLNLLCATHGIIQSKTWLPGIMYMLLSSFFPWQISFQPYLFTSLLLLLIIHQIANYYNQEQQVEKKLMNTGALFCLFPLISVEGWYFLLFIIISVSLFIFYDLNRIFLLLMSIVVPMFFIATLFFAMGWWDQLGQMLIPPVTNLTIPYLMEHRVALGPFTYPAIISAFGLLMMQSKLGTVPSKVRKIHFMFIILLAVDLLILLIRKHNFYLNASLFPLPLSIFTAYFFQYLSANWLKEVLFTVLIVLILFAQLVLAQYA